MFFTFLYNVFSHFGNHFNILEKNCDAVVNLYIMIKRTCKNYQRNHENITEKGGRYANISFTYLNIMMKHNKKTNQKNKCSNVIKGYDIVKLRTRRFIAMLLDWYITNMIAAIPVTFYLRGNDYLRKNSFNLEKYGFETGLIFGLFVIVMAIIYYFIIPTFVFNGQTLGKKICRLRVVKTDGKRVNAKDMFIREIIGATILEGGIVVTATYIRKLIRLFGYASLVTPLQYIAYAITLLSIIYAYFHPLSQSFHDRLSKTVVIKKD